ncbi:hypothetical protein CRM22_001394 [Opisthorchis felineus]|uniref:Uncharacterized protein n=1 Tax=Opisthorchis felineus TaxID=147828 RepID=A0A4S2MB12_OPIFE|nr:hypothetical protein CRM22_001394 [Opisthorchis felineus]
MAFHILDGFKRLFFTKTFPREEELHIRKRRLPNRKQSLCTSYPGTSFEAHHKGNNFYPMERPLKNSLSDISDPSGPYGFWTVSLLTPQDAPRALTIVYEAVKNPIADIHFPSATAPETPDGLETIAKFPHFNDVLALQLQHLYSSLLFSGFPLGLGACYYSPNVPSWQSLQPKWLRLVPKQPHVDAALVG